MCLVESFADKLCKQFWIPFLPSADFFFQNQTFSKKSFRNTIRKSNSLDPGQA